METDPYQQHWQGICRCGTLCGQRRSFKVTHENQNIVGRITELDPAEPRFFVDVRHSNEGLKPVAVSPVPRLGALQQLGHLDFYPGEGTVQQECMFCIETVPRRACSHRSIPWAGT